MIKNSLNVNRKASKSLFSASHFHPPMEKSISELVSLSGKHLDFAFLVRRAGKLYHR